MDTVSTHHPVYEMKDRRLLMKGTWRPCRVHGAFPLCFRDEMFAISRRMDAPNAVENVVPNAPTSLGLYGAAVCRPPLMCSFVLSSHVKLPLHH